VQGDRDFRTLSEYILSFVITYLYIENKFGKMNEKTKTHISGEFDDEVIFVVLELVFRKQVQFKMFI
jgi:hypothetical protein